MKQITRALAAIALAAGVTATGAGTASAASGCTTWQYKVTEKAAVYKYAGSGQIATAWSGYYVNATGHWYNGNHVEYKYGSVYTRDKVRIANSAYINASKLDYITCW